MYRSPPSTRTLPLYAGLTHGLFPQCAQQPACWWYSFGQDARCMEWQPTTAGEASPRRSKSCHYSMATRAVKETAIELVLQKLAAIAR